jgi:small basic protein
MEKKLIGTLSMFGLAMGVMTVFVIPPSIEPFCWLAIFVGCAIVIAKRAPRRYFLHGLCVSLVNSVWITAAHIAFFETYLANHPNEAAMSASMSSPRLMMLGTGPIVGLVSGCVLGLFSWVASKVVKPATP